MVGGSRLLSRFVYSQIGKKYNIGSSDPNHTDCFKMLEEYVSFHDIQFPEDYDGLSKDNYGEKYVEDPEGTMGKLLTFMSTFLTKEDEGKSLPGCVIIIKCINDRIALGIDCGNGYVLTVSDTNGCVVERKTNFKIVEVYKCQLQSL